MTRTEKTIHLLLEVIFIKFPDWKYCPYYQGDEEPCLKVKGEEGWLTCNCNGKIDWCDLSDKYFK